MLRGFLRLRYSFPNKQGRAKLRRWTNMLFSMRQLEYREMASRYGEEYAEKEAKKWREQAREDLGKFDKVLSSMRLEKIL